MRWFRSLNVRSMGQQRGGARRNRRRRRLAIEQCEARQLLTAAMMTSYHNDNSSTGQNLLETQLTPSNVNATTFGKLLTTPVDGQVYAQPLYLGNVNITSGSSLGLHNVAYVATEHDSLYAIDTVSGAVLWKVSFINPSAGITTVPSGDVASSDLTPEIGITATPVIDPASGTIYVVAKTKNPGSHYKQTLWAIDVGNGSVKGSTVIADTVATNPGNPGSSQYTYVSGPAVPGSGAGSVGGVVRFNALRQLGRVGLTLANGNIYMAFASHGDNGPYHGWVLSYNAQSLVLNGVFNTDPNGTEGGIWQSGGVVAVDSAGALYVETGNGTFDTTMNAAGLPSRGDYGDSFIKIVVDPTTSPTNQNINGWGLKAVDYFTPFNQASFDAHDTDLGSGGPMLLPDSAGSAAHPHLLIGGGKEGRIYLIDRDNMGHYSPSSDHVVQESLGQVGPIFDTPAFFNDGATSRIYYGTIGNSLKTFTIANAAFSTTFTAHSNDTFGSPGTTPSISANGSTNGIVWDLDRSTSQLRAYDATNIGNELYTSAQATGGRDALGSVVKFTVPTVVDGRVLVGTSNSLVIYGLLTPPQLGPGPYSLWSTSTVPGWIDNPDSQSVELGVKFRSDDDGYISGLRFYKSTNNTGTHVADLWTTSGTLLATATFTGETATGWQTVLFSQPVPIKAGTVYIASYHTNTGNYSDNIGYFASGVNSGPLHAPADGTSGPNGVYAYGPAGSFPTSTYHASNYWVDVLLTSLVNSVTPSNGATAVAIDASISVRFNAPMNQTTLNSNTLLLQDTQGNSVAINISYDPTSMTATLTPQSPLTKGKTYIVTVKGGANGVSDQNGNTLASDFNSSFATVLPPIALAPEPFSIWSNTASPGVIDNPDSQAVELGVKFRAAGDGFITGIRYYKSANNTGTHIGNLWAADGTLLATATFSGESVSGWQTVLFAQPVAIKASTTYIASYHTNTGNYADDIGFFSKGGVTNGPLTALANGTDGPNGVYQYGASSALPANTYNSSNYWVDVILTSLVGSVTPSNKATGVATNATVQIRFNTAMNAATLNSGTLLLHDASNNNVAVSIAYDPNSLTATLTPNAPLANGTTYTVVVKGGSSGVQDTAGDAMAADFNSTFTTAVSVQTTTPISIFSNSSVPSWIDNPDTQAVELGMKFRSDVAGFITGLRFYKSANNTGTHVANLWSSNGTLLGSATFTNETASGWQTILFAQPIAIQSNTTYIASYHTNVGNYSDNIGFFTNGSVTNGPLHALGDGIDGPDGVYHYGASSAFPSDTYHGSNYWVDVLFTTQGP